MLLAERQSAQFLNDSARNVAAPISVRLHSLTNHTSLKDDRPPLSCVYYFLASMEKLFGIELFRKDVQPA